MEKKKYPKDRALENFDDFYGSVYGYRWKNMRVAMLCERKYMALVNVFGDTEKTCTMLESNGAISVQSLYQSAKEALGERPDTETTEIGNQLDSKMSNLIHRTADTELLSKYLTDTEKLEANEPESQVSYKKSLDQTLKEDSQIQQDRIIDASNTSALYEFVPTKQLKGLEDYMFESDHYKYYSNQVDFPLKFQKDLEIPFPENLKVYTYEKGNTSTYKPPKRGTTGVFSHYLLDGASILPPLVLGLKPGDRVLDACAAPGGKSLIMLQTLYPEILVCNDIQENRCTRIKRVLSDFVYDFEEKWNKDRIFITQENAIMMTEYATYDKILVDVPCTTDRHVLNSNDNNLFKPTRMKERLKIPETQAAILTSCIELLKPGGTLVYSTCSLSPVQNDGVVHMALSNIFKEKGITMTIQ